MDMLTYLEESNPEMGLYRALATMLQRALLGSIVSYVLQYS